MNILRFAKPMKNIFYLIVLLMGLVACTAANEPTVVAQTPPASPTLEPTFTPSPSPTATPQPSPTATPEPISTATPSPTPTATPIPQATLSGQILDQETRQPVTGAQVSVAQITTMTDASGHYTLADLLPGQYVLSVTHSDYDPGLSSIFTLASGEEQLVNLTLFAPDTTPYPQDPMLTNPLDPNGAPTAEEAERLAREQGLTGEVMSIKETRLTGEHLVNYKLDDTIRAAVAELDHEAWELTDDTGRVW